MARDFRWTSIPRISARTRLTRPRPSRARSRSTFGRAAKTRRRRPLELEQLESRRMLSGVPTLVRDINPLGTLPPSPDGPSGEVLGYLTAVGSTLFFAANDGTTGYELWKTDGTPAGTAGIKDIRAGAESALGSSHPFGRIFYRERTAAVGSTLYFFADDGTSGLELWKSDGTEAGTARVKDILGGSGSSAGSVFSRLTAIGSTLYFVAFDGLSGEELWKTDGTEAGTVLVKQIRTDGFSSAPLELTAVGSTLYFSANDGVSGHQLWKSDGTEAGTVRVSDINAGSGGFGPKELTTVGSTLYFKADDGVSGLELWKSDGTEAGTVRVKDIKAGGGNGFLNELQGGYLTAVGSTLYFRADDGVSGLELWKTDGTEAGTVRVADFFPGSTGSYPESLTAVGSTLYFTADDGVSGGELWKTDGTEAGTVRVADIVSGSSTSFPGNLAAVGSTLYFTADDGVAGRELWKTDGTAAGTVRVSDIRAGSSGSFPGNLTAVGSKLYFTADDGVVGREVWVLDTADTIPPTVVITDDVPDTATGPLTFTFSFSESVSGFTADDVVVANGTKGAFNAVNSSVYTIVITPTADTAGTLTVSLNPGAGIDAAGNESLGTSVTQPFDTTPTPTGRSFATAISLDFLNGEANAAGTIGPDEFTIYRMNFLGGRFINVAVDAAGQSTLDPVVRIWNADGVQVAVDDDSGVGLNSSITLYAAGQADALYYIGVSGYPNFSYDPVSGASAPPAPAQPSSTGSYGLAVRVTNEVNTPPTDIALYGNRVIEGRPIGTRIGSFSTADGNAGTGDVFTYSLATGTGDTDNAKFAIDESGRLTTAQVFAVAADTAFSIRVRTTDGAGNMFEKELTVVVENNVAPGGIKLSGSRVLEGPPAGDFVGSLQADDANGSIDDYTFALVDGEGSTDNAKFTIDTANGFVELRTAQVFVIDADTTYSIRVRVTDSGGLTFEKSFPVTVVNNLAPTDIALSNTSIDTTMTGEDAFIGSLSFTDANAGSEQGFIDFPTFTLVGGDGSADNDKFRIVNSYYDGPTLVTRATLSVAGDTTYSVRIRATDRGGLFVEKVFAILVTPPNLNAPAFTSGPTGAVAENAATTTAIYTAATIDADGTAANRGVSYSVKPGVGDAELVEINATTGVVTLKSPADFETKSSYTFTVVATNAGTGATLTTEQPVTVTVTDVNDLAPVFTSGGDGTVIENAATATAIYTATTTDADGTVANRAVTYSIKPGVGDAALVEIDATTGVVTLKAQADFESKPTYAFTVVATNAGTGATLTTEQTVTVSVTDMNESPTAVALTNTTSSLPENTSTASRIKLADIVVTDDALGTNTITLSGADAASVEVIGTSLYLKAGVVLDFETQNSYSVTVNVADAALPGSTTLATGHILSVTDVNDLAPVVTSSATGTVAENAATTTAIYTAATTDADGTVANRGVSYSIKPGVGDAELVEINATTGVVTLKAPADFETKSSYTFTVVATNAGTGATLTAEQPVTVTVTDVNEPPTSVVLTNVLSTLPESTSTASRIKLADIVVTDDALGTSVVTLTGVDTASFEVDGTSLYLRAGVPLDFETKPSYAVTVSVADASLPGGTPATAGFMLSLGNVNEAPTDIGLTPSPAAVSEGQPAGTLVGTLVTTDPDAGGSFGYVLVPGAADNARFRIEGDRLLTGGVFNFEDRPGYTVLVRSTDQGGLSVERSLPVTITNVDEPLRAELVRMPAGRAYRAGEAVDFTVVTSRPVTVVGRPTIAVVAGRGAKSATYVSGSGTNALVFRYVVARGDSAASVSLGGTIRLPPRSTIRSAAGANLPLAIPGGVAPGVSLDTTAPANPTITLGPGVAGGATEGEATQRGGVVTVSGERGATITVTLRGRAGQVARTIAGAGPGVRVPVVLAAADTAALGNGSVTVTATAIDSAGNRSAAATATFPLDTAVPTVRSVAIPAAKNYRVGDVLRFVVTFSETVTVRGRPSIPLTLDGGIVRQAGYVSGSGTKSLVFQYRAQAGDRAVFGPSAAAAIALNAGAIADAAGNGANLALSLPSLSGVLIAAPTTRARAFVGM